MTTHVKNFHSLQYLSVCTHLLEGKMATILADDTLKCIFLDENDKIPIRISLKLFPIMAWHRRGVKPLPETMLNQYIYI